LNGTSRQWEHFLHVLDFVFLGAASRLLADTFTCFSLCRARSWPVRVLKCETRDLNGPAAALKH
jgi:hypothetical protein